MHAVYVLACTFQLTIFSLQCNLSKPDMLSLYQCGKLLNTMCSEQWAAVPVGNTMKRPVIPAAALWHIHLLLIKSQNRARCSSQLHRHNLSNLWILKRPWDGVLWHALTSCEETTKKQVGWPQCFKDLFLLRALIVQFFVGHFELNRIRAIPAWIIHEANSPSIKLLPNPLHCWNKGQTCAFSD